MNLVTQLKNTIKEAGISHRAMWLGCITNVHEWLMVADIFVFASRREGFGTVFTEAMAMKR